LKEEQADVGRVAARRRLRGASLVLGCLTLAVTMIGCLPAAPPIGQVQPQTAAAAQWPIVSDPSVLADGGNYYVYGSDTAPFRMPIHVVDDLNTVDTDASAWFDASIEGMPQKPRWAVDDHVFWAPTVARAANGTYVAFFAENRPNAPEPSNSQCIGRATAAQPQGPFFAEPGPFTCGLGGVGGALDPNLFQDVNGQWYLYAAFSGTDQSIYAFGLDANLDQTRDVYGLASYWNAPVYGKTYAWEGRFLENPAMIYDANTKTYLLTYSGGGDWFSANYVTGLARCATPLGLCSGNPGGPWLAKNSVRTGTGGLSFFTALDGSPKAVYASWTPGTEAVVQRAATVASVLFDRPPEGSPFEKPEGARQVVANGELTLAPP
jgi:Glycosyl hydrolases family 43